MNELQILLALIVTLFSICASYLVGYYNGSHKQLYTEEYINLCIDVEEKTLLLDMYFQLNETSSQLIDKYINDDSDFFLHSVYPTDNWQKYVELSSQLHSLEDSIFWNKK